MGDQRGFQKLIDQQHAGALIEPLQRRGEGAHQGGVVVAQLIHQVLELLRRGVPVGGVVAAALRAAVHGAFFSRFSRFTCFACLVVDRRCVVAVVQGAP